MSDTDLRPGRPADVVRDPVRLAAVRATALVDHEPLEALDRLTNVARSILGVAAAFLSIVEEQRDFYLSQNGLGEPLSSTRSLEGSTLCHLAICSPDPLVIPDTRAEPEYRAVPTVDTLGAATYIGVPVQVPARQVLGSFCVIDREPRNWSDDEITLMIELAASAERVIALREIARAVTRNDPPGADPSDDDPSFWHIPRSDTPMPYCMRCHQVSSTEQRWEPLVDVLAKSGMLVSHSYCPSCAAVLFGGRGRPLNL